MKGPPLPVKKKLKKDPPRPPLSVHKKIQPFGRPEGTYIRNVLFYYIDILTWFLTKLQVRP